MRLGKASQWRIADGWRCNPILVRLADGPVCPGLFLSQALEIGRARRDELMLQADFAEGIRPEKRRGGPIGRRSGTLETDAKRDASYAAEVKTISLISTRYEEMVSLY
jgi:hypothetical protein